MIAFLQKVALTHEVLLEPPALALGGVAPDGQQDLQGHSLAIELPLVHSGEGTWRQLRSAPRHGFKGNNIERQSSLVQETHQCPADRL